MFVERLHTPMRHIHVRSRAIDTSRATGIYISFGARREAYYRLVWWVVFCDSSLPHWVRWLLIYMPFSGCLTRGLNSLPCVAFGLSTDDDSILCFPSVFVCVCQFNHSYSYNQQAILSTKHDYVSQNGFPPFRCEWVDLHY